MITRDGEPVVRLTPEVTTRDQETEGSASTGRFDEAWFDKHRVALAKPLPFTWAESIREERDAGY